MHVQLMLYKSHYNSIKEKHQIYETGVNQIKWDLFLKGIKKTIKNILEKYTCKTGVYQLRPLFKRQFNIQCVSYICIWTLLFKICYKINPFYGHWIKKKWMVISQKNRICSCLSSNQVQCIMFIIYKIYTLVICHTISGGFPSFSPVCKLQVIIKLLRIISVTSLFVL
jgi:hypothetical protein